MCWDARVFVNSVGEDTLFRHTCSSFLHEVHREHVSTCGSLTVRGIHYTVSSPVHFFSKSPGDMEALGLRGMDVMESCLLNPLPPPTSSGPLNPLVTTASLSKNASKMEQQKTN